MKFSIRYKIIEDKELEDFQNLTQLKKEDVFDIHGIIEVTYNDYTFGYYFEDWEWGDEWLLNYFILLNQVRLYLEEHNQVFLAVPESAQEKWIEFNKVGTILHINIFKIETVYTKISEDISYAPLVDDILLNPLNEFLGRKIIHQTQIHFSAFQLSTKNEALKLLNDIKKLNPILCNIDRYIVLEKLL